MRLRFTYDTNARLNIDTKTIDIEIVKSDDIKLKRKFILPDCDIESNLDAIMKDITYSLKEELKKEIKNKVN